MSNILLIHGAWGGAWEFEQIVTSLNAGPHRAWAIDLPGHGESEAHPEDITMETYVCSVVEEIRATDGKVVIVGHSLGGAVISQVAEAIPEKIEGLVYITAMLPQDGDTPLALMESDPDGELLPRIVYSDDQSTATVETETLEQVFLHDVEEANLDQLVPRFRIPQAVQPFLVPAKLSDASFGSVPKFYVRCSLDKILSPILQGRMMSSWDLERVFELESGHYPLLSMPGPLAEAIGTAARAVVSAVPAPSAS